MSVRPCGECGEERNRGRVDESDDVWYCDHCWDRYELDSKGEARVQAKDASSQGDAGYASSHCSLDGQDSGTSGSLRSVDDVDDDVAWLLNELANAGDWVGVVALEDEALALVREIRREHPANAGAIYGVLGKGFRNVGQYARALTLHEQNKSICEELGDRAGVAEACGNLGNCYYSTGDYGRALALHEQNKSICEELGDRAGAARACANLGNCY